MSQRIKPDDTLYSSMNTLANKHVLLGVSGGIAAYKTAELVRLLRAQNAEVQVVMTEAATAFITPLTLQALSGRPVRTKILDQAEESAMGHIDLARWADVVVVAPASADFMAKLSHGLADDLLSTLCLATASPVLLAPAMNRQMWMAPATRANHARLIEYGYTLVGPEEGPQACGDVGPGRMAEPATLVAWLGRFLSPGLLSGLSVLVTAGPTREAIDPVRFIGNRSSGRMGYAIASAAAAADARVTMISGPVSLETPPGVERIDVVSAVDMHEAVMSRVSNADIFIAVAAVADYRPVRPAPSKIKKEQPILELTLERNPDIVAGVAAMPKRPFCVGFAAETDDLENNARHKLTNKSLDMVAANRVGPTGPGFESLENSLSLYWEGGSVVLPLASKEQLALELIEVIAKRYSEKSTA